MYYYKFNNNEKSFHGDSGHNADDDNDGADIMHQ